MIDSVKKYVKSQLSEIAGKKILLGISGGSDSVALLHLLKGMEVEIFLAHANFQLRGNESEEDAEFVKKLAKKNDVPIFYKIFKIKKTDSIQEKARELRYNWFRALANENNIDFIATAHHRDDQIETFFLNLFRGAGIKGLSAMPFANKNHIRPLLIFSKKEIENYIKSNKLKYREDASNASDKYNRNYIRHHITTAIEKLNPNNLPAIVQSIEHIQTTYHFIQSNLAAFKKAIVETKNKQTIVNKTKLLNFPNHLFLLHYFLEEFNFPPSKTGEFLKLLEAKNGKKISSSTYTIIKQNGDSLIILDNETFIVEAEQTFDLDFSRKEQFIENNSIEMKISILKQKEVKNFKLGNSEILIDIDAVSGSSFKIKTVEKTDVFTPFGSKQTINILAFLKNQKIPLHQRINCKILTNSKKIVWVIGIRMAHQFQCTKTTKTILKFQLLKSHNILQTAID